MNKDFHSFSDCHDSDASLPYIYIMISISVNYHSCLLKAQKLLFLTLPKIGSTNQ